MEIIRTVADMKARAAAWKAEGLSIGLVPTMGSLHEGHESLMDAAREASDRVVVSVFVNPIQFGPGEDYEAYPRDLERDARICERHGVDVVFHPEVDDMYAPAHNTFVVMETLTDSLCGASRPGHFRGVCTVVTKLFNIVQPHRAFFGQKDAQQLAIIKRMVADLNMNVTVVGCPIVREADGLAKSSRNAYLSAEERQAALVLSRAVFAGKEAVEAGERDAAVLKALMSGIIEAEPLARIDYVEVVDGATMQPTDAIGAMALIAMAVYIGNTRLIDNFIFEEGSSMLLNVLKGKIHRARVVQAELDYVGSITVDAALAEAAGILEYEKVQVVDIDNGNRFETYVIAGEPGSGMICVNGAAAHCVEPGHKVIIMCYAQMTPEEFADPDNAPRVVFVDDDNRIARVTRYEKHGRLEDM